MYQYTEVSKEKMLPTQVHIQNTFSMTSRASFIGFAMHLTADTAPESKLFPSMIMASISTSPSSFRTDPQPKDKKKRKKQNKETKINQQKKKKKKNR